MNDGPKDGPGPSRRFAKAHPERVYGGPDPVQFKSSNMHKMTASQAEAYYAKLPDAHQPILPRTSRFAGIGAWVLGAVACGYMVLYADFGDHEHVFSPVRRKFHEYTNDLFTLSKSERSLLGLDSKTMDSVRQKVAEEKRAV